MAVELSSDNSIGTQGGPMFDDGRWARDRLPDLAGRLGPQCHYRHFQTIVALEETSTGA